MFTKEQQELKEQLIIADKNFREAAARSHEAKEEYYRIWRLLHPPEQYGDWGELA